MACQRGRLAGYHLNWRDACPRVSKFLYPWFRALWTQAGSGRGQRIRTPPVIAGSAGSGLMLMRHRFQAGRIIGIHQC